MAADDQIRSAAPSREKALRAMDAARHRIPFWWWLTYDALVLAVILGGTRPSEWSFWLGMAVLSIAVAIDTVEFLVKRPSARAMLDA